MQPTVQKVSESKSGFDGAFYDGESYVVSKDLSNGEQYRIYEKASSGFVSLDAIITDAEQRAKDFCGGKRPSNEKTKGTDI